MAEIDDATIARLQELCDHARAAKATYGCGYDEACLLEIGELSVAALPALLEERDTLRRDNVDKARAWDAIAEKNAEIARLREERDEARLALRPFAAFVSAFDAMPLRGIGDAFYTIHGGTAYEASIGLSDCRKARAALEAHAEPGEEGGG